VCRRARGSKSGTLFLSYYFPVIHVATIFCYITSIYHLDFSDTTLTAQYDDYYMMYAPIHRSRARNFRCWSTCGYRNKINKLTQSICTVRVVLRPCASRGCLFTDTGTRQHPPPMAHGARTYYTQNKTVGLTVARR
jgi:hypothetical protein